MNNRSVLKTKLVSAPYIVWSVLFIVAPLIFVVYYFLKKSTLISIIPNSASATTVAFKRSLIENKNISEEEAQQIIKIVANLVENANLK